MQYKVTKQYIKGVESLLAEFTDLNDSGLYLDHISSTDHSKLELIYRLYDDNNLIDEYNKCKYKSSISRAQYAEKDADLPEHINAPYRVTYRAKKNKEYILATFPVIDDARLFVYLKFRANLHQQPDDPTYAIYHVSRLIETIDQNSIDRQNDASSQDKKKSLAFRPTPFSRSLTLGPKNYLVEEDDEDEDDKNPD